MAGSWTLRHALRGAKVVWRHYTGRKVRSEITLVRRNLKTLPVWTSSGQFRRSVSEVQASALARGTGEQERRESVNDLAHDGSSATIEAADPGNGLGGRSVEIRGS